MRRFLAHLRRAFRNGFHHDIFGLAKACAYSAIFALFPALIVTAAVIVLLPDNSILRHQLALIINRVFPAPVSDLLDSYFPHGPRAEGAGLPIGAAFISLSGASGVMLTLMEGFRRAYDLPQGTWGFWKRRAVSYLLVPTSILPLGLASVLVVFGHFIAVWLYNLSPYHARTFNYFSALILRWIVAILGTSGILASIYHFGTPYSVSWRHSLPGACFATIMWLLTTLGFGWYVTNIANYSKVYGSLGAGIALLVWLYLASVSVLLGAELNASLRPRSGVVSRLRRFR